MSPKKSNNQEVEFRAILKPGQRQKVCSTLAKLNATKKQTQQLKDIYYCPIDTRSFRQIEMDEIGSYSLRLRESKEAHHVTREMNVKVITNHGDHNAWKELELTVNSLVEADKILQAIHFKPFFRVEKRRTEYRLRQATIILEDVKKFGTLVEIEIMTARNRASQAKEKIKSLFRELGISHEQIVPKSVTNILMKKLARF